MNQQDAPLRGLRAPGPCSPPRSSPGSTSWRIARRFRGWMWTKARADGRAPARVCVAGLCGAGEGARAADNAGRGPAARRSPPFTACRSLFFLFGPRLTRFEGRGIHLKPLGDRSSQGSDGRAAAALPGSLWCLARASSTGRPGFKCLFLSVSSVSKRRRGEVAADRTRLRRDISAGGRPLIKGREPEEEPLALPFFVELPPDATVRAAARPLYPTARVLFALGGQVVVPRASRGQQLRICRSQPKGRAGCRSARHWARLLLPRPRGAAARHDPALCSHFQVYLCPFQFSVTLRKGETKQKSLFISFQGL